jgi:CRISPR system Cascade subunit CasC
MGRTIIDLHVLQTVPPSNINRDDLGRPKTAVYGGALRARVSSQAWKRAIRIAFKDRFDEKELGIRTKQIVSVVADEILKLAPEKSSDAEQLAIGILGLAGVSFKKNKAKDGDENGKEAEALFFLGRTQAKKLAALAIEGDADKKTAQEALKGGSAVDVALFGRMVASAPELNTDACAQVAHAISVHEIENEFDYFTAVDDRKPDDSAGADMIGTVEYNSSTLYRYATVTVDALNGQLGSIDATCKAVVEFVRAFILSMPTGKQNTFANSTLPSAALIALRTDQAVNFVGAFEKAVDSVGATKNAERALADYANNIYETYSGLPEKSWVFAIGDGDERFLDLGERKKLDDILIELAAATGDSLVRA